MLVHAWLLYSLSLACGDHHYLQHKSVCPYHAIWRSQFTIIKVGGGGGNFFSPPIYLLYFLNLFLGQGAFLAESYTACSSVCHKERFDLQGSAIGKVGIEVFLEV